MANRLRDYLEDPLLGRLYAEVRAAGPIKPISLDLTHACNIRCTGCYFFADGMDRHASPPEESAFEDFLDSEQARGTNFVTIVGGEPALSLDRLKTTYDRFSVNVATNGFYKIPREDFENLPIGVAVWGDRDTDRQLRGGGKLDVFARALRNYRDDPRAFWYYTVCAGDSHQVEQVVEECVANGNRVLFNFYGDIDALGGTLDHRPGFAAVRREIERSIERYPERIFTTAYLAQVVSEGRLYDESWGWDVCTSITADHPINAGRVANGKPHNPHFRAYNADFTSTRRCCTGTHRDCSTCFDVWEHFSWIMLNLRKHLGSREEFSRWLTTMYLFYLVNRLVDFEAGCDLLPEIHQRAGF